MNPPSPQVPKQPWPAGKVLSLVMVLAGILVLAGFGLNVALERLRLSNLEYRFDMNAASFDSCLGSIEAMQDAAGLNISEDPSTTYDAEVSDHDRYECSFRAVDRSGKDIGPIDIKITIHTDGDASNPSEKHFEDVQQDSGLEVISDELPGYEFGYCYRFIDSGDGVGTQMCRARDGNLELDIDASTREIADVTAMATELMPYLKAAFGNK